MRWQQGRRRLPPRTSSSVSKLVDDGRRLVKGQKARQNDAICISAQNSLGRVKRVRDDLDVWLLCSDNDTHDIEPTGDGREAAPDEVVERHSDEPALLHRSDSGQGTPEVFTGTRLDFYEHENITVTGDDVDLAMSGAIAAGKDGVPASAKFLTGDLFARFTELCLVWCRHPCRRCNGRTRLFRYLRFQRVPVGESSNTMPRVSRSARI